MPLLHTSTPTDNHQPAPTAPPQTPQARPIIAVTRDAAATARHAQRSKAVQAAAAAAGEPPSPQAAAPASPTQRSGRPAATPRSPAAGAQQRRAKSAPRAAAPTTTEPVFDRLFKLGNERAAARGGRPAAPEWMRDRAARTRRMSEGTWSKVTERLFDEARVRAERMAARREEAARPTSPVIGSRSRSRSASPRRQQGGGGGYVYGGGYGFAADGACAASGWSRTTFLDRQRAYEQRKVEKLDRELRAKEEAAEEDIERNCTCGFDRAGGASIDRVI
jgi:hypothetical protein